MWKVKVAQPESQIGQLHNVLRYHRVELNAMESASQKTNAGYTFSITLDDTVVNLELLFSSQVKMDGQIVPETTIRFKVAKKIHADQIANRLASDIIYKILEAERCRLAVIRNELETIAQKERVQRVKVSNEVGSSHKCLANTTRMHDSHTITCRYVYFSSFQGSACNDCAV